MPLYFPPPGGGASIGAVTLFRTNGTTDVFNPEEDSDASRGAAFLSGLGAYNPGDLLVLGPGGFTIPLMEVDSLNLGGQGETTVLRGELIASLLLTGGTSTFTNLIIEGGLPMEGGSVKARNMTIKGAAGSPAIIRTGAEGTAELINVYLKAGVSSGISINSGGFDFEVFTINTTANADPDANVLLSTPEGFSVNPDYP